MRALVAPLALLLLLAAAGGARGQEPPQPFGFSLTAWNQVLTEVSQAAERPDLTADQVAAQRARLAELLSAIASARDEVQGRLSPLLSQLEALGPPPAEGEPAESPDVALNREDLNEQITALQGQVQRADLAEARALDLDSQLGAFVRGATVERLLYRQPYPLAPETIAVAVPEFFAHLGELAVAPAAWWATLSPEQKREILFFRFTFILVFAFGFGWLARRMLLARLGRTAEIEEPTYARRLTGAIAEALGNGLIPALIFGGVLYRTIVGQSLFTGLMSDIVIAFCIAMIIIFLVRAAARAALAPDMPAWRLEAIPPENARTITWTVTLLAAVFGVDIFLSQTTQGLSVSLELESLFVLVSGSIEAVLLIALARGRLWELEPAEEGAEAAAEEGTRQASGRFWTLLRWAVVAIAAGTIVAALLGYINLSSHLLGSLLVSSGFVGALYLLRGLLRELIGVAMRSGLVQDKLELRHPTRNLIKFWTRALLDLAFLAIGVMLLLPVWGVPLTDMLRWSGRALQGITVGNVTFSLTDLLAGLLVFVVVIVVTRMIQRLLSHRVLPQTTLDSGVQNSISAGLGYIGIAIAAALAISTIGLDLSNLAIIAGALSVGIGFGLQTVVNNFVSGLILLIERPIKVGDWIIAGGYEGYVKRINVRATELETFQRASVIIPNSELIASSVTNWTHKNKLGRVEVPVGVAYGSDVDLVIETLTECLKADSRILNWPEPYVLFRNFGDSSLDFEARGYIGDVEWVITIGSDLRVAIDRAFREKGIEIPFPQRDINLKDIDRLAEAIVGRDSGAAGESLPPPGTVVSASRRPRRRPAIAESDADGEGDS